MEQSTDTNAAIWQSEEFVESWMAKAGEREAKRSAQRQLMAELLPFVEQDEFTFLDLGAGSGAAARAILDHFPRCTAILADFSPQMMGEGIQAMEPFSGRYRYVELDMTTGIWPATIPSTLDAVVSSMCIHHIPDRRKQELFAEIFERLTPGGWYLNYDPVSTEDPVVAEVWQRTSDRLDPGSVSARLHRTPQEQAHHENHVRHMIPLEQQLGYLRDAGFQGIDVYWKQLENVIYGGCRPA